MWRTSITAVLAALVAVLTAGIASADTWEGDGEPPIDRNRYWVELDVERVIEFDAGVFEVHADWRSWGSEESGGLLPDVEVVTDGWVSLRSVTLDGEPLEVAPDHRGTPTFSFATGGGMEHVLVFTVRAERPSEAIMVNVELPQYGGMVPVNSHRLPLRGDVGDGVICTTPSGAVYSTSGNCLGTDWEPAHDAEAPENGSRDGDLQRPAEPSESVGAGSGQQDGTSEGAASENEGGERPSEGVALDEASPEAAISADGCSSTGIEHSGWLGAVALFALIGLRRRMSRGARR